MPEHSLGDIRAKMEQVRGGLVGCTIPAWMPNLIQGILEQLPSPRLAAAPGPYSVCPGNVGSEPGAQTCWHVQDSHGRALAVFGLDEKSTAQLLAGSWVAENLLRQAGEELRHWPSNSRDKLARQIDRHLETNAT